MVAKWNNSSGFARHLAQKLGSGQVRNMLGFPWIFPLGLVFPNTYITSDGYGSGSKNWKIEHQGCYQVYTVLLMLDDKLNQMSWPHNNVVSSMHNIKEVGAGRVDLLLSPQNTTRYPIQWKKDLVTVFYVEGSTT